jgi:hypothetical protein
LDEDTVLTFGDGLTLTGSDVDVDYGGDGSAETLSRSDHSHSAYVYTAGDALTLTGQDFDVDFAGTGSALSCAHSDHTHDLTEPDHLEVGNPTGTASSGEVIADDKVESEGQLKGSYVNVGSPSSPASAAGDLVAADRIQAEGQLKGSYLNVGSPSSPASAAGDLAIADDARIEGDAVVVGDAYTVAWTNYSGSSTIVGWSSRSTTIIEYKKVGDFVFCHFRIIGTSNSTSTSFTLPYNENSSTNIVATCLCEDNGTRAIGYLSMASNTVTLVKNATSASTDWTNSGDKEIYGQFCYEST